MSKQQAEPLLRPASFMASGTLFSRILGLLRDILMTSYFDRSVTDAWAGAFRLGNLFRRLLSEGGVSGLVTPRYQEQNEDVRALWFGDAILVFSLMGLLLSLGFYLHAESFLDSFLGGRFFQSGDKSFAVLMMAKQMAPYFFFILLFNVVSAVLQVMGRFGWIGLAPAIFNLVMIVFMFLPKSWWSFSFEALSLGVSIGALAQLLVLWPLFASSKFKPKFDFYFFKRSSVWKLSFLILPYMFASAGTQLLTFINMHMVASLGEGPVSFLYLCDRLLEFPVTILSVSLGAVLLPALGKDSDKNKLLSDSIFWILFLALPSCLGLLAFADRIVACLFLHGKFSLKDVVQTALVLKYYSVMVVTGGLFKILAQYYFQMKRILIPLVSVLLSALYLILVDQFVGVVDLQGPALQTTIASFILLIPMIFFLPVGVLRAVFKSKIEFMKITILNVIFVISLFVFELIAARLGYNYFELSWAYNAIVLILLMLASGIFFFGLIKAFGFERLKIEDLLQSISKKLTSPS